MKSKKFERLNRTGAATNPDEAAKTMEGAQSAPPSSDGDGTALAAARAPYIADGEPVGSRPPGAGTKVVPVLLDKLGDRLAFERSGTRLYETLLGKVQASGPIEGGPSEADVQHIMQEEARHFAVVGAAIERLGGDPTIETPSADLSGVAASGIVQILSDPRTTVPQCLHALLTAELTDNDGWAMLIRLTDSLGHQELTTEFQKALMSEQEHLVKVRGWLDALTESEISAGSRGKKRT